MSWFLMQQQQQAQTVVGSLERQLADKEEVRTQEVVSLSTQIQKERFENEEFKIRGMKMTSLSTDTLNEHYAHVADRPFFPEILNFMQVKFCFNIVKIIKSII